MKADLIHTGHIYRMKPSVFLDTVQANGDPHLSNEVTITYIGYRKDYRTPRFYDASGNCYAHSDFKDMVR